MTTPSNDVTLHSRSLPATGTAATGVVGGATHVAPPGADVAAADVVGGSVTAIVPGSVGWPVVARSVVGAAVVGAVVVTAWTVGAGCAVVAGRADVVEEPLHPATAINAPAMSTEASGRRSRFDGRLGIDNIVEFYEQANDSGPRGSDGRHRRRPRSS